ncbi:porin family protein [Niabella sp.]|uniref:porin family protein n=1 Tax=Niabella sp. TaxID=1962976 RepID=UPI0026105B18|nr:porin family protein [Niabella sp.]
MKSEFNKRFFLSATLLCWFAVCLAQVKPGIKAGLNVSNVYQLNDGKKVGTQPNIGFQAGVTMDVPVSKSFFIQPGLLFSTKGAYEEERTDGITARFTQTPFYIELPVNAVYALPVGRAALLLGGGPYLAYGLGGTYKLRLKEGANTFTKEGSLRFKDDMSQQEVAELQNMQYWEDLPSQITYARPFDLGIGVLAGFRFKEKWIIQYNAQAGILNLLPSVAGQKISNISMRSTQFCISAGYLF